jgi:hypothetical protein
MDPNTALLALRALTNQLAESDDPDVALLCELTQGLDKWMAEGGFLPRDWTDPYRLRPVYQVLGNYERPTPSGTISGQLPTFYLHSGAQGILSEEGARRIAQDLLSASHDYDANVTFHLRINKLQTNAESK